MIEVTITGSKDNRVDTFSALGLGLKRRDIPVLPDTREYAQIIAGMDGEVDFGAEYGTRTIQHECILMANDPNADYQAKIIKLAQVFNTKRGDVYLTYSDLPDRRYKARYSGTLPIQKIIFDGELTIPMKMHDPFPESLRDTRIYEYGQGLEYGQGYEYNNHSVPVSVDGQVFTIENSGTTDSYPIISIAGAFTNLTLTNDEGTAFTFGGTNGATDILEINCNLRKKTIKLNGLNAFSRSNGVFFALRPGITTFTLNASNPNLIISFLFRHQYLY
jgi:phage-related protein